jgi:hypothetical protein
MSLPVQATIVADSGAIEVDRHEWYTCAAHNKVMISRQFVSNPNGAYYRVWCGTVMYKGSVANVRNEVRSYWFDAERGEHPARINTVITGMIADLTGSDWQLQHGQAELITGAGEKLNVRVVPKWHHNPDKSHEARCPANSALVLLSWQRSYVCATIWSGNPVGTQPTGMVSFRPPETNVPCSLPVPAGATGEEWTYVLTAQDSPCHDNTAESIELEKLTSATRILLTDSEVCEKTDDFWIELRTTTKSVTFSHLNLDEFFTYSPGIVGEGLMLVGTHRKSGAHAVKNLSCVRITTSSAPPSS